MPSLLRLMTWPLRTAISEAEREVQAPLVETERDILGAVNAIHRATDSLEHHVEVIEGLATSVGPLTDSVDRLTDTMRDLVGLLAPMATAQHGIQSAEHEVHRAERFFGFGRHKDASQAPPQAPADAPPADAGS